MIVVCGLPFNFEKYLSFISYISDTYNSSFTGLSKGTIKRDIFEFQQKYCQYLCAYFEIINCKVASTTDISYNPNGFN